MITRNRVALTDLDAPAGRGAAVNSLRHRSAILGLTVLALCAALATGAAVHREAARDAAEARWTADVLRSLSVLLTDDQAIINALQRQSTAATGADLLESYLRDIRATGVPRNAPVKQQLDRLAENNATIVALIGIYGPHARTAGFMSAGDRFRTYAAAWRDRWNSVMETFMSGGNYAAAGVPFPLEMPSALLTEAAATH